MNLLKKMPSNGIVCDNTSLLSSDSSSSSLGIARAAILNDDKAVLKQLITKEPWLLSQKDHIGIKICLSFLNIGDL